MALNQFPRRAFEGAATLQTFTGNGSNTSFTLSQSQFQNECFVYVSDVAQVPGTDFIINGTTLSFTVAPGNGEEIIVRGFGVPTPLNSVSDASITSAKLATGAIEAKLGYTPANQTDIQNQINNLIDSAPGALDTLNELAAALGDDANFATTVTNSLATKVTKTGDTMSGGLTIDTIADDSFKVFKESTNKTPVALFAGNSLANITNGNTFSIDIAQGEGLTNLVGGAIINTSGSGYSYTGTRGTSRITLGDGDMAFKTGTLGSSAGQSAGTAVSWNTKEAIINKNGLYFGSLAAAPTVYAVFNGNTGAVISYYGDYSSVSRITTGNYRLNFSRAMSNTNYIWYINSDCSGSRTGNHVGPATGITGYYWVYNTNYLQFTLAEYGGISRTDTEVVYVAIWEGI